jgi:hypothetical protein
MMMKRRSTDKLITDFKYDCLVRFVIETLPELSNEQLDALANQAGFVLEDRLRETSERKGQG